MNEELVKQQEYWDREVQAFDSIYSHKKSPLANWLDNTFRWDMYARFDYTMKHSEPIANRKFLDVGCGTGRYALEYARLGAERVVGIDIAEEMIKVCEERAKLEKVQDKCDFLLTDLLQYQPDTPFDVCIGIGLFDYIRDSLPVLTKMREVVSDRAIMSLPKSGTWRAAARKVRLSLRNCDVFFYSKDQIDSLLKQAGFARYTMEEVGQLYCVTAFVK